MSESEKVIMLGNEAIARGSIRGRSESIRRLSRYAEHRDQ